MRRQIAFRKRKQILRRGAKIISEGWEKDDNGKYYPKGEGGYVIHLVHCGWKIAAPGDDILSAYNGALFAVKCAEEDPRKDNA